MHLTRLIFATIQIYLCNSVVLEEPGDELNELLKSEGWKTISNMIVNEKAKEILLNKCPSKDALEYLNGNRELNASHLLSSLHGRLLLEIFGFFHTTSFYCMENDIEGEDVLTQFKKLLEIIKVFEPLRVCMTEAMAYLNSHYPAIDALRDSENRYKEINEFLSDENLTKLKNENEHYKNVIFNKFEEIHQYHFEMSMRRDLFAIPDFNSFVMEYINQFKVFFEKEEEPYPNPYHPDMAKKVDEGVQKFCKDFGFVEVNE